MCASALPCSHTENDDIEGRQTAALSAGPCQLNGDFYGILYDVILSCHQ